MVLSGYIVEKYDCMSNAYTCNRLVEEAEKLDIDLRITGVHDTYCMQDGIYNSREKLGHRDFLINRYKWGKVKDQLNGLVTRTYNATEAYDLYVNKYEQVRRIRSDAFLIPRYVMGTSLISFSLIVDRIGLPFVAKGLESSMGQEIVLIEKEADYLGLRRTWGIAKEWLFEEFIKSSFGRDMRFYSIRGEVTACMQRRSGGDFRANVALGASVEPYEITPAIRKAAADIYRQTGLDFIGIDLLFGDDKPYFCEINVMPGIEGIETASGVNVAGKIMETIKEDFRE